MKGFGTAGGEGTPVRTPTPPEPLVDWVRRFGQVEPDVGGPELEEGALRALEAALERPGRNREGAFALLAADALLTWACEDAVGSADPETELLDLLARLGPQGGR